MESHEFEDLKRVRTLFFALAPTFSTNSRGNAYYADYNTTQQQLCTCSTLFCTFFLSLPLHHDVKMCIPFSRFMEDMIKRRSNFPSLYGVDAKFSFSLWPLDMFLRNSTPVDFAYIWHRKWNGIIEMKIEKMLIHFLSDVFVAVAVGVLGS